MGKTSSLAIAFMFVACCVLAGSAFAFDDIQGRADENTLNSMKERGLISGKTDGRFHPDGQLTFAEGIQLLVRSFDLNIDDLRYIKEPLASGYYDHAEDDAWYAEAFIIAQFKLGLPQDVQPNAVMTREQFAHYLFAAMTAKGEFAFIELYMMIGDEDQVTPAYMNAIQKLLISKAAQLDEDGNFRPQAPITRAEAAVMTNKALEVVQALLEQQNNAPLPGEEVTMNVEPVNEEINKVTLSWGEQPNSGYRLTIDRVEFSEENIAMIFYTLHYPQPDMMYLQVIEEKTATVYLSSNIKPLAVFSGRTGEPPAHDSSSSETVHSPELLDSPERSSGE